jgi:hypothetical protein
MFRISKLSGRYLAAEFKSLESQYEREVVAVLVEEGTPVLLCDSIEDASDFLGIDASAIEVV